MAAYVEMDQVTKTYQMGEVTIKAADGISFQVKRENLWSWSDQVEQEKQRC